MDAECKTMLVLLIGVVVPGGDPWDAEGGRPGGSPEAALRTDSRAAAVLGKLAARAATVAAVLGKLGAFVISIFFIRWSEDVRCSWEFAWEWGGHRGVS